MEKNDRLPDDGSGEKLKVAWKEAWSVESKEEHGFRGDLHFIGTVLEGSRAYKFYEDDDGHYFYKSDAGTELDEAVKRRRKKRPV